ncbi:MAG TPA: hypothetical protein VGV15_21240 [Terriglobales bacterium]|nr:hypothetical protein [Terriglobales bacterium]
MSSIHGGETWSALAAARSGGELVGWRHEMKEIHGSLEHMST